MVDITTTKDYSKPHVIDMGVSESELNFGVLIVIPLEAGVKLFLEQNTPLFYEGQVDASYYTDDTPDALHIRAYGLINPGYDAALRELLGETLYQQLLKGHYAWEIDAETAQAITDRLVTNLTPGS